MSWTTELCKVYDLAIQKPPEPGRPMLLPLSHSTANAQIELTVNMAGEFVDACALNKEDAVAVIPVTEASAVRTGGITPMPLDDKLVYLAGDYEKYSDGRKKYGEYCSAYMEQLKTWRESKHSVPVLDAIYTYLEKGTLIADLVSSGIIELDDKNRFSDKKLQNVEQADAFVRFIVIDKDLICKTWEDTELRDAFINYNESMMSDIGFCHATGEMTPVSYKHPNKIRNSGDKAKLISSNDESGFSYKGRFADKQEAFAVGYKFSQKVHSALKWLIANQYVTKTDAKGKTFSYNPLQFDSMTLVVWNSALGFVPSVMKSVFETLGCTVEEYNSVPEYAGLLNKMLLSKGVNIDKDNVIIMGLDAATTGRMSISIYSELSSSQFYANLMKWYNDTMWTRYNLKQKARIKDSSGLLEIITCAYGTEQNGRIECSKKILSNTVLRLLPCVTEGRRVPDDIIRMLCNRASKPLSYEYEYNHKTVLENACALIRKAYKDDNKGEISMAFDPNCTDRSYLYGCLLAVADKAEKDAYEKKEKSRITNARRFWSSFSSRPYQTWRIIEERLEPYLEKKPWIMTKYTKLINEIMSKMDTDVFADNSELSPMYLIGYHHYSEILWAIPDKTEDNDETDNEEE